MAAAADGQAELEDILARLDEKPSLARFAGAARQLDELHERRPGTLTDRAILIVRNYTVEPIEPLLKVAAARAGFHVRLAYSGYEPGAAATLDTATREEPDFVVLAMRLEELAPRLTRDFLSTDADTAGALADDAVDHVVSLAERLREGTRAPVLVHNFVAPRTLAAGIADSQDPHGQLNLVRAMNVDLASGLAQVDGAHLLDLDHLLSQVGLLESHDLRLTRVSDAPFSQAALRALAEAQVRHLTAIRGVRAKCVVVDCDNTLWGGVVGEDGPTGIVLGDSGAGWQHLELQHALLDLRQRGIVLAICSKNEQSDVLNVLRSHPDCVLSEGDFAAMRINWQNKAENIESLADELNLGLEHLVFLDDNPAECDLVKRMLPQVQVVQWPGGLGESGSLDDLGLFDTLSLTSEDRMRTEMYRAEGRRRAAREDVTSVEDYLRSLEMVATVGVADAEHLPRVAQLTQRTNQFNLTTRRHDLTALELMMADRDTRVLWLDLRDRFGSNGLVGCGIVRREGGSAVIDTLLLSCRVIGRDAERVLVNRLGSAAVEMGASTLLGEYIPSERNGQVSSLYPQLGFEGPAEGPWEWSLTEGPPTAPDWIEIVDAEEAAV